MSAESLAPSGVEFRAPRPKVETSRGTEVSSSFADRLVATANRVASFMDRLKGGKTEVVETAQEKFDQGRTFLRTTGEKAVGTAIRVGNVVSATALVGAEFAVGAAILTGNAVEQGAQKVGAKVSEISGYAEDGINGGIDYVGKKADALVAGVRETAGYVTEGIAGGFDFAKQKGTEVKEAVTGKFEAVRGFFQNRAETAKQNMQKLRRNWVAQYSKTRRGAINTVEAGRAFAQETGENIKHNGRVIRKTGQLAIANYRANAVPVMPK